MIYTLWKSGVMDAFVKLDMIRPTIVWYCKIYEEYLTHRNAGKNYTEAVELTAEKLCTTDGTVKRAISFVM